MYQKADTDSNYLKNAFLKLVRNKDKMTIIYIILLFFVLPCIICKNLITGELTETVERCMPKVELQTIAPEDVSLIVYTRANPTGTQIQLSNASNVTDVSPFNPELKTVFYVHGWRETVEAESSTMIRKGFLQVANVNIIIVNYDKCANNIDYFYSKRCSLDVGKYVGQFIGIVAQTYSYSLSDVTAVGHSLGAHIAGYIGKANNGSLGVIIGLDPAGPFFFENNTDERITKDDAQYVQGIHADAIFLGVNYNVGDSDFWPNGGYIQNGCGLDADCSHLRAYKYYAESLTNNKFFARQCDSYSNFEDGKCNQNPKSMMAGAIINTSVTGTYYLKTNSTSPFGLGDI